MLCVWVCPESWDWIKHFFFLHPRTGSKVISLICWEQPSVCSFISFSVSFFSGLGTLSPGGIWIIFWWGVPPKVWNPYPFLRIFLSFFFFFLIFTNRDPFLRFFLLPPKMTGFNFFFFFFLQFLWNGPSSKDFFDQNGTKSKDFWWKSNPFRRHIPICLNLWVPLPLPWALSKSGSIMTTTSVFLHGMTG